MKIAKDDIIDDFKLVAFGAKGWLSNPDLACPECKRTGKFGIKFSDKSGSAHCFFCNYAVGIVNYLKLTGREKYIEYDEQFSTKIKLRALIPEWGEEEELPEVKLPRGYERIGYDPYLKNRNFKAIQYEQFEVGITNHFIEKRLHNYLIFVMIQRGRRVGWIARSKYTYQWHADNLATYKAGKGPLTLRYMNSTGTDFGKILGGFDTIPPDTKEVIIVEGLFDAANVSSLLRTHLSDEVKVVFTFGNKVSDDQQKLLRSTNVKRTIIMYDYGTQDQAKKYAAELSRYFESYACDWPLVRNNCGEEIDPGNCDYQLLTDVLSKKVNHIKFYNSKLLKLQ